MINLTKSPTKFCGGIGLLWRGINLSFLNRHLWSIFRSCSFLRDPHSNQQYLFESSRSAIFHALSSMEIGVGCEVIVCAFTCDAVTYAVMKTGATVVYVDVNDDLTMSSTAVISAITDNTKALIVQNTFGRLGLDTITIENVKSKGIFVLEDCALSIGSKSNGVPHGRLGHISTWSLEVSKTLTIGWGGVLNVNDPSLFERFHSYFHELKQVPFIHDIRRLSQLWLSVFLTSNTPPFGVYLWYFLHGFRIFRRSKDSQRNYWLNHSVMGSYSATLFSSVQSSAPEAFRITNNNYHTFMSQANQLGLDFPICPDHTEFVVSPRFSLIVDDVHRELLIKSAASFGIEVGCWFDESPPSFNLNHARVSSCTNAQRISKTIINFSCHWSLTRSEISILLNWMKTIPSLIS